MVCLGFILTLNFIPLELVQLLVQLIWIKVFVCDAFQIWILAILLIYDFLFFLNFSFLIAYIR